MVIELTKSTLRPFKLSDSKSLCMHANDRKISDFLMDHFPTPYTQEHADTFITRVASSTLNIILAIDVLGEAIGCISIHPQNDVYRYNAELGYWISTKFQRKGIMTEAVNALVSYTFDYLDIERIYAKVFENNVASARLLEKCGFELDTTQHMAICKNNVFMDELIFARLKLNRFE